MGSQRTARRSQGGSNGGGGGGDRRAGGARKGGDGAAGPDGGGGAADGASDVRSIMDAIRRIVRVLRVSSRACEKQVGLSGAQLFVLHKLEEAPALSLNQLADRTRTHQSSVSV